MPFHCVAVDAVNSMIHELVFTSVPEGLRPGSQGFCTVAHSLGIPSNLAMRLEAFSAYRHLYQSSSSNSALNPVRCMHLTLNFGDKQYHVLSRVADAGLDYTQRTNKIAHHFLFEGPDCPESGPAALFFIPNLFLDAWKRRPGILPTRPAFPSLDLMPLAGAWERLGFDRRWANVVAETISTERPVHMLFEPGTDVLPLFAEAMARIPIDQRWRITFSSYYSKLPPGVSCQWKGIVLGSPEVAEVGTSDALVLDLSRPLGKPSVRKASPPPIPMPSPSSIIQPEPETDEIYEIAPPVERPSQSTFSALAVEYPSSPSQGISPKLAGLLLLVAFLFGCGVGAVVYARWFQSQPPRTFLLDCIDLLLPDIMDD